MFPIGRTIVGRETLLSFARLFLTLVSFQSVVLASGLFGDPIKLRVTADQANIREKPDITSVILLQVQEGSFLEADRKEGEWYAVRIEQEGGALIFGYVHESLVIPVELPKVEEKTKLPEKKRISETPPEKKEPPTIPQPSVRRGSKTHARPARFSLSLWWGGRNAGVGDLNLGAEGLAQFYASALSVPFEGKIKSIHTGFVAGGEIQLPLGSHFFFAAGAEYFSSDASSTVTFGEKDPRPTYLARPGVQVIPLSLSILFYPVGFFNLRTGLEYSLARLTFLYRFETSGSWQKWKGSADGSVLGYYFGVGTDWAISRHVSLVVEGLYRRSIVPSFEGEGTYLESSGSDSSVKGKLYFFQKATSADKSVSLVFLGENAPAELGVTDVREAELDLRGLSLRVGLKIKF
ncbi:MAG: hypothetical protein ACUVV5_08790 [Candidatus Aminicenantales bacterium]